MNPFYKVYCRVFQTVFKIALPILPYRTPNILPTVADLPAVLLKNGKKHVLIVTDAFIRKIGLMNSLEETLREHHLQYTVYDRVVPNPTVQNVEEARDLYLQNGCDALIGFGGGSSIDCAKAVGARIARPKRSIPKMKGILHVMRPIPFLIAIPTTAGTGSETTLATVITDGGSGHKFPINDFFLIPKVAVLDPSLTVSLPPSVTAATGMDALTHAIEAYIGRSTIKSTCAEALTAVKLIAENIQKAYTDGNDLQARENMLRAAFLAGSAFTKSYVGYCHAVAHSLGGKYNTPHGLANAVLLPYVLQSYGDTIDKKAKDLAVAMHLATEQTSACRAKDTLIAWIRRQNRAMELPEKIKGVQKEDIPLLASYAAKEANPLYPVPVLMDAEKLQTFYYDVLEES